MDAATLVHSMQALKLASGGHQFASVGKNKSSASVY